MIPEIEMNNRNEQLQTHVLHKVLYCENSKMRFLWCCDNGKINCIS